MNTLGIFPPMDDMIWQIARVSRLVLPSDLLWIQRLDRHEIDPGKARNQARLAGMWMEYVRMPQIEAERRRDARRSTFRQAA